MNLSNNSPVMSVHLISNGFILEVHGKLQDQSLFIYAKDEVGIAEEIIAAQARLKLDVEPKQGEMFQPNEMRNMKK